MKNVASGIEVQLKGKLSDGTTVTSNKFTLPVGTDGRGIESVQISYAISLSGSEVPTDWSNTVLIPEKGKYLWKREITTYTDGTKYSSYTAAYSGMDGTGAVMGVKGNTEIAYRAGNVNLTPANIGAVNKNGDTMTGELTNVKGQQVRGRKSVAITNTLVNEASGFYEDAFEQYSRYLVIGEGGDKFLVGWQYNSPSQIHAKVYNSGNLQLDGIIPYIEPNKLEPTTANGWTVGDKNLRIPSAGVYMVSINNGESFIMSFPASNSLVAFVAPFNESTVIFGLYLVGTLWRANFSSGGEVNITSVAYKRIA